MEQRMERAAEIARIGLLFLDGDDLQNVLLDKTGPTNYDFLKFCRLKAVLSGMEEIDPALKVTGVLWLPYPTNPRVAIPAVAGNALPVEGCKRQKMPEPMYQSWLSGQPQVTLRPTQGEGCFSYYIPVKNSLDEQVGILELLVGRNRLGDVSNMDMFVPPRTDNEEGWE